VDLGGITYDVSLLSSIAIILGTLFVVIQIRQTNRMIRVSARQAESAAVQARLTTEQLQQDHKLANMDLIMRIYEFANTAEVQASWLTVINAHISTYEDFQELPKSDQVAFYQIGALFESLGVLVEREVVNVEIVEDMFLTQLAWDSMKPFVAGVRERFGEEESYAAFERLHERISRK
jgi:hypothetical protein